MSEVEDAAASATLTSSLVGDGSGTLLPGFWEGSLTPMGKNRALRPSGCWRGGIGAVIAVRARVSGTCPCENRVTRLMCMVWSIPRSTRLAVRWWLDDNNSGGELTR